MTERTTDSNTDNHKNDFLLVDNGSFFQYARYISTVLTIHHTSILNYREDFYLGDRFHSSAPHGDRCIAGCEAHTNFAHESTCLTAYRFGMK
jgi:hypothetical protein